MLELRPTCEHCRKALPYNATDAMICSYECTFCAQCVAEILHNVCPNCGGGFSYRPIRPKKMIIQNPSATGNIYKTINLQAFSKLLEEYRHTPPAER